MATITEELLKTLQKEVEKTIKIFPFSEKIQINFYPKYNNEFVITIDDCEFCNKNLDEAIKEAIDFFKLDNYLKFYEEEEKEKSYYEGHSCAC